MPKTGKLKKLLIIVVALSVVAICAVPTLYILFYLIVAEQATQRILPEIQSVLDQTCGAGVVVVERQYYVLDPGIYSSPDAFCSKREDGEYRCECRLDDTP